MDNQKPEVKVSKSNSKVDMNYTSGTLWNAITQEDASKVSQNMYNGEDNEAKYVESDLVNSYAWDTAIVYIQKMGNNNYANQKESEDILENTGTTDDNGVLPITTRGGGYKGTGQFAGRRTLNGRFHNVPGVGFRPLLYLK